MDETRAALDAAHAHALTWLDSLDTRPVPGRAGVEEVRRRLGDLPEGPSAPVEVVDHLAEAAEPGLVAMPSGRFFGFVIGGSLPAALASDWLVSAWDQNSGLRDLTPAVSAVEETTEAWILDLLGLPAESAVGYVTGATMANFTCLAAGRDEVLRRAGWDVAARGLVGGPGVRVLAGEERHSTIDLALRYLGLGLPETVPADDQGRVDVDAMVAALEDGDDRPTLVALQAGNLHSGGFDDVARVVEAARARGAWVHVDGAFGLWAAASPRLRHLVAGVERADSWTTDAHKTLNVPYDCGLAIVRDRAAMRAAMGLQAAYFIPSATVGALEPFDKTPEISRRARAVPVWAALRQLGRSGVADLVERLADHARLVADGFADLGAEVLNDVVYTQVCVAFDDDDRTQEVVRRVLEDGEAWMTGSRWRDRAVLRVSMSSWATTEDDVRRSLACVARAARAAGVTVG